MLNLDAIRSVTTVITHAGCPDGVASAMILHSALPDAEIVFLRHGSPEIDGLVAAPGMLFCDIAPPAHRVPEFVEAGAFVLDHHGTAKYIVGDFGERGVFGDEETQPGVCGAWLAYREVWLKLVERYSPPPGASHVPPVATVERFAKLAGIRDTWQRNDSQWDEACAQAAALRFYPWKDLAKAHPHEWNKLLDIGWTLLSNQAHLVAGLIRDGFRTTINDKRVIIVSSIETSDVADTLGAEVNIVAGFSYRCDDGQPKLVISLRGRGVDVSAIAKHFGGGGHRAAAGFTVGVGRLSPQPYEHVHACLAQGIG